MGTYYASQWGLCPVVGFIMPRKAEGTDYTQQWDSFVQPNRAYGIFIVHRSDDVLYTAVFSMPSRGSLDVCPVVRDSVCMPSGGTHAFERLAQHFAQQEQ